MGGDAAGGPWRCSGLVGAGSWAWGAGLKGWRDEAGRAPAAVRSAMKVVAAVSVTIGGRRAGLPLSPWRWDLAWAWVWLQVEVVVRRRVWMAAWRWSWVSAGLRAGASLGRGPWPRWGCSRWGRVWGPVREAFPVPFGGQVLDKGVVVVADEVVVVVEVVESEARERAVGDGRGSWAAGVGVGCWVL